MKLRTMAIAALVLVLAVTGAFAAFQVADQARAEAAQTTIEQTDELAVEPDIRQALVSDEDHDPTAYGESITVTHDGEEWEEGEEYEYYPDAAEIEFLVDEDGPATVEYQYEIPEDQVVDQQVQTVVGGWENVAMLGGGLSLAMIFLILGAFVAKRIGIGSSNNFSSNR